MGSQGKLTPTVARHINATTHWETVNGTAMAPGDYMAVTNHFIQIGSGGANEDHSVVVTLVNDSDSSQTSPFPSNSDADRRNPPSNRRA